MHPFPVETDICLWHIEVSSLPLTREVDFCRGQKDEGREREPIFERQEIPNFYKNHNLVNYDLPNRN
jgi:hypothetical protein